MYVLSGFLCVALVVKIIQLRTGARRNRRNTMLIIALASFTVAALAGIAPIRERIAFENRPGIASLTMDTGVSISLALLAAYLWRPLRRARSAPWWRSRLLVAACVVSVILIVLMETTPPALRTNPLQNQYTADWRIVGIYIIGNLFFLYCSAASAIACLRITRIVQDHVAIGMRVGAVGMIAYSATCINRLALVAAQLSGHGYFSWYSVLNFVFTEAAVLTCVLGLHFTAVWKLGATIGRFRRDLSTFRHLGRTWKLLTAERPEVVLKPEPGLRGLRERTDLSYRAYRRLIECEDALLLLVGGDRQEDREAETARTAAGRWSAEPELADSDPATRMPA